MSNRKSFRWLSLLLCLMMVVTLFPTAALAYDPSYQSETHTVFKHTEQTLAPGVEYYNNYAYSSDGKQMVYYVTTADITRDDVVLQTSYLNQYKDGQPGMSKLTEQVAFANQYYSDPNNPLYLSDYYNVVSGVNASFYNMQTGQPSGVCFVDGVDFGTDAYPAFFAILKDGTAVMDDRGNKGNYTGDRAIWQAVGGSQWLVRDGEDVTANTSGSYNTDRHSRTCVGITEDGKVVLMVLDGRQEPFSCGGSMHELAQIMLEAGCKYAMNIDGGGSTTFVARPEGEDAVKIINRPSDGSERSISSGLIVASLAAPSNVFDHVAISADNVYAAPGAQVAVSVAGVSPAGTAAEIPADLTYAVVGGTFADGVFTAGSETGDATITAMYEGNPVGSLTIHVVNPDKIVFSSENITIPYGKTSSLDMIATYGLNEIATVPENYSFALENPAAATINGQEITAGDDTSIASTVITASFVGTDLTASANLIFGKGSEVIFDFEDGTTNGFNTGYGSYNYYLPRGGTSVVTAETGKVHSGDYALAVNVDYSNSQESGYMMNALYRVTPEGQEKETAFQSANKIGCWIYIPDEYVGLWVRWILYPLSEMNEDGTFTKGGSITSNVMDGGAGGTGVVYSFNESGWHYLSCDFSNYNGAVWSDNLYFMQFYISDRDGTSYNYYAKNAHNINGDFTVYIDDITVDYSTVIDDREAPEFSGVTYATSGMSDAAALNDGATLASNTIDFAAAVAENTAKSNATGLNASSAKAYVDGNEVPCTFSNGTISMDNSTVLSAGQHVIKFSICDNQGNYASVIRKVNITSGDASSVKVVAHDPSLDRILFGSLYYVDVVANEIENVQSVTTTLNLDSMSKWELDHMVVADGFEATYTYEPADKILHLTLTKTGNVSATGEQALVSIPVRVWELNNVGSRVGGSNTVLEEGNKYTYSWFKSQNEYWKVAVEVRVQQGSVVLADGSSETFTGENVYCDTEAWAIQKFMVETQEGKDYKAAWNGGHIHTAEAVADVAPTCSEPGYTGRTYCDVCHSVVDWGTTVPALGHAYAVDPADGLMKCANCGDLFSGELDGKTYADGALAQGWQGNKYFVDGQFVTGVYNVEDVYYEFGDDGESLGKYTGLVQDAEGVYHYAKLGVPAGGWFEIDEEWYYFDTETLAPVAEKTFTYPNSKAVTTYQFEANGKIVDGVWVELSAGTRYYYGPDFYKLTAKTGNVWFADVHGVTYGFNGSGFRYEGLSFVKQSNNPQYLANFADDGAYLGPYTGIYEGSYYEDGFVAKLGKMVKLDDTYYYITQQGKVYTNGTLYLNEAMTNGFFSAGNYTFDENGALILKQGLVDGYYYENGELVKGKGLVDIEGDLYFIKQNGAVYVGTGLFVSEAKANGLVAAGSYDFDEHGKMIRKDGVIDGFYYENGSIVKGKGIVKVGNDLYFVKQNGAVYVGNGLSVPEAKTNGLIAPGLYDFDENGKLMLKNGVIDGYYYENGSIVKGKGIVEDGGFYYFVKQNGAVYKNGSLFVNASKTNGLVDAGTYQFDADGKMILG